MTELTPRQVRALILLLVLAPLLPTTLMLQLMINSVRAEQSAAQERTRELYQQTLRAAGASLTPHLAAGNFSATELPRRVLQFFERVFDKDVTVRLVDEHGKKMAGADEPASAALAEFALDAPRGWRAQLFEIGGRSLQDGLSEQIAVYTWATAVAVAANLAIAGLAGYALSQQMRLQEMKSSALATVSHELKTPLASMRLLIETLETAPQKLGDYLPLLAQENARLARITENFLALARLESRKHARHREEATLASLFESALETLRGRVEETRPEVLREIAGDLPVLHVDRNAMTVAFANLIDNALKYSGAAKTITLRGRLEGNRVVIEVADNGQGIAASAQKKIFAPFYQADPKLSRSHQGCGLGLSIVKGIVEEHGGTIRVTSAEGVGSTFRIELPAR